MSLEDLLWQQYEDAKAGHTVISTGKDASKVIKIEVTGAKEVLEKLERAKKIEKAAKWVSFWYFTSWEYWDKLGREDFSETEEKDTQKYIRSQEKFEKAMKRLRKVLENE